MANSGSFNTKDTGGIGANYPKRATYSWWINSQSVEKNTTSIGYKLVLGGGASSGSSIATYNCSTTTDGESKSFAGKGTYYGNGKELISGTKTIKHNADGTKTFSASATINLYWASGHSVSGSGSWTLPTIARQAYLSTVQDFNDDSNPTITYTNAAGNAVGSLQACIASPDGQTIYVQYRDINKTGTLSYTFYLSNAERDTLRAACPNGNSLAVKFFVRTIIGSTTFYDSKDATMWIVNANPSFGNFGYADTNGTITAITGNNQVLVSGKSTLAVTISSADKAVANKQSSMQTYLASLSGKSVSAYYSSGGNTLNFTDNYFAAGTQTLAVRATDSRGNSTTVNKNVTIVDYYNPYLNAVATRLNNFENNTTVAFSGSISPITVGGVRKNDLVGNVQYRYKNQNTSTWGSWTNLTASVAADGALTINSITLSLDNTASWDLEVRATDKLATTTKAIVISQGQPQFFIGSDGRSAVGGTPSYSLDTGDTGLLDVKGKIYARDIYKNNIQVPNIDYGLTGSEYRGGVGWGDNFDSLHTIAATYRVYEGTSPFGDTWWGTLMCVGDRWYMQQFAICNWTAAVPAATRVAVRTWVSNNGDNNGNWTAWAYLDTQAQNQDWQFIGGATSTSAVTNGCIVAVDIPAEWQNCSLKIMAKCELSATGWVDLRTYDTSWNANMHTVNTIYSRGGVIGSEGLTDRYYLASISSAQPYRNHMFQATSMRGNDYNYRTWISECGDGFNMNQTSALQQSGYTVASVSLWTYGTAQNTACLKVWGMKP